MKIKYILSFAIINLLVVLDADAQIQLSTDDVYSKGTFQMGYDTSGGIDPGTPGANKTWNFGSLKNHQPYTITVAAYIDNGRGIDANLVEIDDSDSTFIKKTSNDLWLVFPEGMLGGGASELVKTFSFPVTFNKSETSTLKSKTYYTGDDFGFPLIDSVRINTTVKYVSKADAWGNLQIPMGSFNSLRIRTNVYIIAKVEGKTGPLPYYPLSAFDQNDSANFYNWYTNGKGYLLAAYYPDADEMDFMVSGTLSTKNNFVSVPDLVVNNPFNHEISLDNKGNDKLLVSILDGTGKQITNLKIDRNSQISVESSDFPAGIYTLQIYNLNTRASSFRKLVK